MMYPEPDAIGERYSGKCVRRRDRCQRESRSASICVIARRWAPDDGDRYCAVCDSVDDFAFLAIEGWEAY